MIADAHNGSPPSLWNSVSIGALLFGVAFVAAVTYLPTLGFDFVYDDHWVLINNGYLRRPDALGELFTHDAVTHHIPDAFRPMSVLFDVFTYQVFGFGSWIHHALSIALHIAVCIAMARLLGRMGAPRAHAIGAAGLFAVLAIHAEAVAVVSFREDLLAAWLGFSALECAEGAVHARRRLWLCVAASTLMALGCAAKLSAAPLPLVWLALHATRWSRPAPLRGTLAPVLALLAGVAAVLLWRIHLLGDVSPYAGERVYANVAGRSATWAASLQIHLLYLQQMLIPIGLGPEYADRGASWSAPATIVAASAWLSLAIWALVCALRGRHRLATAVIFGALLLALPTSNIWGMPNMRADRFMYLPSALVCLGAAAFLDRAGRSLARRFGHPWLEVAPLVLAVVVQGAAAQGAAAAYRNDSVLWRTALVHAPDSARAHSVYGELLAARLQLDELARQSPTLRARAHAHCQIALELEPSSALPHLCAARLASAERRWNDAYRSFQRALQRGPQRGDRVMVALASTVMDVTEFPYHDRIERAFAHIEQAHAEYPYSPEPPIVAAALQHRLGRADLAKKWLATASTLAPERWDIVTRGVELDLDLGHPLAASTAWNTHQSTLRHAHPEQLAGLRRRLDRARRTWTPSPFSEPILLERTNEP